MLDLRLHSRVIKYRKGFNSEDAIDPRFNIHQQDSFFSWSKFGSLTFSFLLVTDCQAAKPNLSHLQPFSPRTCPQHHKTNPDDGKGTSKDYCTVVKQK